MKNKKNSVRIGLVQMACGENPDGNLKKAIVRIATAAKKGARIVCLQELFRTRYFCQTKSKKNFKFSETIPSLTTDALVRLSKKLKVVLIAPVFERTANGVHYNTAVVIDHGVVLGQYRKMHIPDDPGFYEKFYFKPGDKGFITFKTSVAKISVLICYDQWFPEAARLAALGGAQILFYPTAIGWKPTAKKETESYRAAWETVQRGHAIANGVYVAAVNRVGQEGHLKFWGSSFVADPFGEIIHRASTTQEEVIVVDCDLSKIEKTRREWPFFRDRRTDAYSR